MVRRAPHMRLSVGVWVEPWGGETGLWMRAGWAQQRNAVWSLHWDRTECSQAGPLGQQRVYQDSEPHSRMKIALLLLLNGTCGSFSRQESFWHKLWKSVRSFAVQWKSVYVTWFVFTWCLASGAACTCLEAQGHFRQAEGRSDPPWKMKPGDRKQRQKRKTNEEPVIRMVPL